MTDADRPTDTPVLVSTGVIERQIVALPPLVVPAPRPSRLARVARYVGPVLIALAALATAVATNQHVTDALANQLAEERRIEACLAGLSAKADSLRGRILVDIVRADQVGPPAADAAGASALAAADDLASALDAADAAYAAVARGEDPPGCPGG